MKKNFFTREVKVGIMAITAIFVLYFGLNFLKGIDIFSSINEYYGTYDNIGGLVPSSPVYVKGFKVGQVEEVKYDFTKKTAFVVKISVSKDIVVPLDAKMELFDDGLMGGKAIQLVLTENFASTGYYHSQDTIPTLVGMGLIGQLSGELMPKIESISTQADSLLRSVRNLLDSKELSNSLSSIEKTTGDLAVTSYQLKKLMSNDLPHIMNNVNIVTSDFKQISGNLSKVDFASTFSNIDYTIKNLNLLTDNINNSKGTIGLLINDKNLYMNLTEATESADKLLIDLKQNPKRYVNFSLFGK